jgi:hypothetical protein
MATHGPRRPGCAPCEPIMAVMRNKPKPRSEVIHVNTCVKNQSPWSEFR